MNIKYKLLHFFSGRNGMDTLAKAVIWPSLVLMLISGFIPVVWLSMLLYLISIIGVVYAYFRIFSKKIWKRQAENRAFTSFLKMNKVRFQQRKTHRFFRCPDCKAWLRVPKGKGTITITCNACQKRFDRKT